MATGLFVSELRKFLEIFVKFVVLRASHCDAHVADKNVVRDTVLAKPALSTKDKLAPTLVTHYKMYL